MSKDQVNPFFLQASLRAFKDYCDTCPEGMEKPTFDQWVKEAAEIKPPKPTRVAACVRMAFFDPNFIFGQHG